MDLSEKQIYRFQDVEVNTLCSSLLCGGKERHLRPKSFQVLVYLLENREKLVSKDELMQNVWADTAVTDDALVQSIKEIRRAVGDDSHNSRFIKTIPKAGYRFIGEVENGAYLEEITHVELEIEEDDEKERRSDGATKTGRYFLAVAPSHRLIVIATVICLIITATFVFFRSGKQNAEIVLPNESGKKTVAVMFFENRSQSAELEWLGEGLADMLITNLSNSDKLAVLSRSQLHLLIERSGHRPINLDETLEIARKARAQLIVTGGFAKLGEKIRVDVSLIDANNGQIQASESLIVERAEQILTEIDLLGLRLLAHLGAENRQENRTDLGVAMTANLEAYRFYSLGMEKVQGAQSKEAIEFFEKAIALDADFAMAHARIGYTYAVAWGQAEEGKPHLEKAFRLSERLTEKDRLNIKAWYEIANLDFSATILTYREIINKYPLEIESYRHLGKLLQGEGQTEEAIEVLRRGLAVDAEAKNLYNSLGNILSAEGKHEEAINAHRRFVALVPNEPNAYDSLGLSLQWSGNYAEAIENYNRALEIKPDFEIALVHLANAKFQRGQYREAIEVFRRYIQFAKSDGERARGYNSLAVVYLKKGDLPAAEKAAAEAVKAGKSPIWEPVIIWLESRNAAKIKEFETLIYAPGNFAGRGARLHDRNTLFLRGSLALKKNNADEAIANFRETLRLAPPTWNLLTFEDCLANAYLEIGFLDVAIAEYERILRLNPNYPLVHFHLAQAFEKKGLTDEARNNYRRFLEVWNEADADIPEIISAKNFLARFE